MDELKKAALKDRILVFAQDLDNYFEPVVLYREFLGPEYTVDYVHVLIKEIIDHDPNLLDIMSGNGAKIFMLSATVYTPDFLEEGGFKKLAEVEEGKWDAFLKQLSNTRVLSRKEKSNLAQQIPTLPERGSILGWLLLCGILLALFLSLYNLFTSVSKDATDERLLLEQQIHESEERLRLENELLREELRELRKELGKIRDTVQNSN